MNSDVEHCMLSFSIPIKVEPQDILVLVQEKEFKILNENNDNKKAEQRNKKSLKKSCLKPIRVFKLNIPNFKGKRRGNSDED